MPLLRIKRSYRYTSTQKLVVGTQLGILSVFNRKSGYSDCVDRIPGHPHSIDALCNIPSHYPNAQSTILTGSSDGLLRAVQLLPTNLLGIVADHGEFPIERIAVDHGGEGRWVGSVGHEEVLKLTDLKEVFEDEGEDDEDDEDEKDEEADEDGLELVTAESGGESKKSSCYEEGIDKPGVEEPAEEREQEVDGDPSSSDEEVAERKKRRKKKDKDPLKAVKKSKGRNEVEVNPGFFADL